MEKSGDILTHESLVWLCSVINQTANLHKDIILRKKKNLIYFDQYKGVNP